MKKLLAIMALLLISTGAMAQLKVITQIENTYEKVMNKLYFDSSDSTYFIKSETLNRFDDYLYIKIGKGKKQATQTLNDLLDFMANAEKDDALVIDNGYCQDYMIIKRDKFNIWIGSDKHTSGSYFRKMQLENMIWYLSDRDY